MGQHVVIREIDRAEPSLIDRLGNAGTATVHEAMGRIGFVGSQIRPIQTDTKIGGSAITVSSHPGDNLMIHAAIEMCQPGDVIVVSHTAPTTHGEFGDLLATSLMANGVVGFITDGGVRDTADIREMGLPVWAQHVSCQGTEKNTPGSVNVPIVLGGVTIMPGDVICADDDGVVVVERERAGWAVEVTEARLTKEVGTRAKLEAGELGVDFYNLRDKFIALGGEYIDRR
jgi:4-hydroxy-4-methyl-2-oxoglutarate aldolase